MNMITGVLLWSLLLGGMTACISTTAQGLRDDPKGMVQVEVAQPYQAVYRLIVTKAQECYPMWGPQTTLFPDVQRGTVALSYPSPYYPSKPLVIDIQGLETGGSRVTAYYATRAFADDAHAVEDWIVNSGAAQCP